MIRTAAATAVAGTLVVSLTGCALWPGDPEPAETTPREQAGPTLAQGPPPAGWQDVRSPHGLLYSVPPDWEVGTPFAGEEDGEASPDTGTDWGSGYLTSANAIAGADYCPMGSGRSFRALTGISVAVIPGEAQEQAESASRAMADSIDRYFTQAGADVPVPEARSIGVSGVPAWYVSLRGEVHPPRNECTPPVIRFDTVAVSTRTTDGAPASIVFVLMADEDQPGVQDPAVIDAVVASLRYDNSV